MMGRERPTRLSYSQTNQENSFNEAYLNSLTPIGGLMGMGFNVRGSVVRPRGRVRPVVNGASSRLVSSVVRPRPSVRPFVGVMAEIQFGPRRVCQSDRRPLPFRAPVDPFAFTFVRPISQNELRTDEPHADPVR